MIRTIAHVIAWMVIAIALYTSQGCARHTEVIILKTPGSIEYAQIEEMYR